MDRFTALLVMQNARYPGRGLTSGQEAAPSSRSWLLRLLAATGPPRLLYKPRPLPAPQLASDSSTLLKVGGQRIRMGFSYYIDYGL